MLVAALAALTAVIWLALLFGRGFYWLGRVRDDERVPAPACWPSVVAVIPARNEAAVIGEAVGSLMRQDYPGALSVIVVDDDSNDGTAAVAQAAGAGSARVLTVLTGAALPPGGGEPAKAYMAYLAALKKGDLDALSKTMTKERSAEILAHRSDPDFKMMFAFIQQSAMRDPKVTKGFSKGDSATLELAGKDGDGNAATSTATLMKEGGSWRLAKESMSSHVQ